MYFILIIYFILLQYVISISILLEKGKEQCIIDEFIENNYFVIKYKIFTEDNIQINDLLPKFILRVKNAESNRVIYYHTLSAQKSKFSHTVESTGLYKLCMYVKTDVPNSFLRHKIYANLKITSDNMEKMDLTNAIKSNDVERMEDKADNIIDLLSKANDKKKSKINNEKENSLVTISNAKMYKYLNMIQIIISAIIGLIQLNNFRRFLKSKHIV